MGKTKGESKDSQLPGAGMDTEVKHLWCVT